MTEIAIHSQISMESSSRWRFLIILMLAMSCSVVTTLGINVLLEPIKIEFGLSDAVVGAIPGMTMALTFCLLSLPAGMLADRVNRKTLVAGSMLLTGVATALGGLATNVWALLASRLVSGAGLTPSTPAGASLIGDLFPPDKRATAFGIFFLGAPLGFLLGYLPLTLIAASYGWHVAIFASGLPCIVIALLLFFLSKEPQRGATEPAGYVRPAPMPLVPTLRQAFSSPVLAMAIAGLTLNSLAQGPFLSWVPALLIRTYDVPLPWIGAVMAIANGVFGVAGAFLGGFLADRFGRRSIFWKAGVPALGSLLALLTAFAIVAAPNAAIAILMTALWSLACHTQNGPGYDICHRLAPAGTSGTLIAFLNIMQMLGAVALGPELGGLISDLLRPFAGADSIRYTLLIAGMLNLVTIALFLGVARGLVKKAV